MKAATPHPTISLCVAAKGGGDATAFAEALREQAIVRGDGVDVHIAHDGPLANASQLAQDGCQFHACPPGTSILRLWGRAIAASRGAFVAVLDVSCPPQGRWWRAVLREANAGTPVFAGPVLPGWPAEDPAVAGYLVDYVQFHPPFHPAVHEVPGINFVCQRALLAPPETLVERGFFKTFTLWRLARERGISPVRRDDMPVAYRRRLELRAFLRRRYLHGRCFAGMRHRQPGQPPRALCAAFAPLLPMLKCWRIARAAHRHAATRAALRRQAHWVLAAETAWSWGELLGYLAGPGGSCERLD